MQSAYRIQVVPDTPAFRETVAFWDTGKVASDRSIHVPYGGPALESSRRYYWRVRVWDGAQNAWAWSQPAYWEMGLLRPEDWKAKWIEPGLDEDSSRSQPVPLLRGRFNVNGTVKSARVRHGARAV